MRVARDSEIGGWGEACSGRRHASPIGIQLASTQGHWWASPVEKPGPSHDRQGACAYYGWAWTRRTALSRGQQVRL